MDILYIIIPAYNESANISKVIDDWYPIAKKHNADGKSRLVIIDDGSHDDTLQIIKNRSSSLPLLVALTKSNGGHGDTVLYGYRYAISKGADYIFQTDSDGQTNPLEFERFWQLRTHYDAVIGNRSQRKDGTERKVVENTLRFILWVIFGVRVPDSNAPFRLMKGPLLEKYIGKLPTHYNLPNVMLTTYFTFFHERVRFVDITFNPRQGGNNSINIKSIAKIGLLAMGDFLRLRRNIGTAKA